MRFGKHNASWKNAFALVLITVVVLSCTVPQEAFPLADDNISQQGDPSETLPGYPEGVPTSQPNGQTRFAGGCDNSRFSPHMDFEIQKVPVLDEPPARIPFHDPVFGTCLVRVTDRGSDLNPGDASMGMKNEYSRVQTFNADGSRLIVYTTDGNWYLYDTASLFPLGQLPIEHEPRWASEDLDLLYFTEETRLISYNVSTGQQQIVHEFAGDFPGQSLAAVWTKYEGSPSVDGRYWGFMVEDRDWMTVALLIYDIETDQMVAVRETVPAEIDSVTISPSGDYLLAFYDHPCPRGQIGGDKKPCGLMIYDKTLQNGRGLLRIVGHADLALDTRGEQVLVYQDLDQDSLSMLDLVTGEITPLLPIDFSHSALGFHFSGRAFQSPGWVVVSTSNGTQPSSTWMDDQIFVVELREDGRVMRLAHTRSVYDEYIEHDYWAEPHASANQDLTKIVFTSNWGRSGTDQVDMYLVNLPNDWLPRLP